MEQELKINFEDLKDVTKAKRVVKDVQEFVDNVIKQRDELLNQAEISNKVATEYQNHLFTVSKTVGDLTQAMKNIHVMLGSKKDLWQDDSEMNDLMNTISTFVMSSGAIKLGVLSNETDEH